MRARTIPVPELSESVGGLQLCPTAASPDHFLSALATGNQSRHRGMHQPGQPSAYHHSWVCFGLLRSSKKHSPRGKLHTLCLLRSCQPLCVWTAATRTHAVKHWFIAVVTFIDTFAAKYQVRQQRLLSPLCLVTCQPFYQGEALSPTCSNRPPFEQSESKLHWATCEATSW